MIPKNIEQITEQDLQALVDSSVAEHKTIEYKRILPSSSDSDKKEFLADISSFANANGGDLIFGITEENGVAKSLDGINANDIDKEILRLESTIRDGIEPRIPAIHTNPIPLINSRITLIIRVPKSWISPHRVRANDKFYSRSSNGKYPLDVNELRIAFNLSETTTERIRNFRVDRISKLMSNETPVPLYDYPKIVLHLIPVVSFSPTQSYDISKVASNPTSMPPIYVTGCSWRYNLDGFLTYAKDRDGKSYSYVQLYRNGIIEAVEGQLLEPDGGRLLIPSIAYEQELIKSLDIYLAVLKTLNVEMPIVVFLSLLGVKGYWMGVDKSKFSIGEIHTIDRDVLLLPEIMIENREDKAGKAFKLCFDSIWNACGFKKDFNYNDAGEWAHPR